MSWGRKLSLLGPDGLDLGSWGRLEIMDRQHLGVRTSSGIREIQVGGLVERGVDLVGWFDPETGIALLASRVPELSGSTSTTTEPWF